MSALTTTVPTPSVPTRPAPAATVPPARAPGGPVPLTDPPTWSVNPDIVLRVAGLPVETADRLRFPVSTDWADAVIAAEQALARESGEVADLLAALVSDPEREVERGRLIALRRDVFNRRAPRPAGLSVLGTCPADVADRVGSWTRQREGLADLVARGDAVLAEETGRRRQALREVAAHPRLRHGLVLGSPTVDAYLPSYLAAGDTLNKRQRRLERTLLEYVYRVACKTSPFSTFTGLSLGRVAEPGQETTGIHVGAVDPVWRSSAQANVALVGRLVEAIVDDPRAFPDLTVDLSPGLTQQSERLRFVRRSVSRGDDTATVSFDLATDSLFFLRRRESLATLVGLFDGGTRLSVADVVSRLADRTGEDEGTCHDFVRHLLAVGLLWLPDLGADVFAPDPLADFATRLSSLAHLDWAQDLPDRVRALSAVVQRYAASPSPQERRDLLADLRARLVALFADLGHADASLPVTLLFEDAVSARDEVVLDPRVWQDSVVAPLARVASLLECREMTLPSRLLLHGFFLTRYGRGGRCDDVLELLHSFAEDVYDEFGRVAMKMPPFDAEGRATPYQNWLRVPELDALNEARSFLSRRMHELWADHRGDGPLELPDDVVDGVADRLGPLTHALRPQGYFLQLGGDPSAPEVVVNRPTGGLLFSFSRFTNAFGAEAVERLRAHGRQVAGEAVLAEVTGGLDRTNLNLHQPLTDHHIVSPAEGSSFPDDRQLSVDDLYVVHDVATDRLQLRSRRLGKEVLPVYLGYLMPTALPEVPRNLLLFSPAGMVDLDLWGGVPAAPPVDGTRVRPQLRYRNVVLGRRTWTVDSTDLPVRVAGETDAGWLLRWRRWQRERGLPDQVFVTLPGTSDPAPGRSAHGDTGPGQQGVDEPSVAPARGRRSKPTYLDFTSIFSVGVFAGEAQSTSGAVEMAEMLPTEEQQYVRSPEGHHVCELAVELVRRPTTDDSEARR